MVQGMQQLELQMAVQKQQQQEDLVKIMAAQAMTLGNLTVSQAGPAQRSKARPGPRERQRQREEQQRHEQVAQSPQQLLLPPQPQHQQQHCAPASKEAIESLESQRRNAEEVQQQQDYQKGMVQEHCQKSCDGDRNTKPLPRVQEKYDADLQRRRLPWPWHFWLFVVPAWMAYLWPRPANSALWDDVSVEVPHLLTPQPPEDFRVALSNSSNTMVAEAGGEEALVTARKMRELGHMRLSLSDCAGAEHLFSKAQAMLTKNSLLAKGSDNTKLELDRGFALVCSQQFAEGAYVLKQALFEGTSLQDAPAHVVNALSYAYFRTRDYQRSKEILEQLVKVNPENPLLWNNLGVVSLSVGDITTADDALYYAMNQARRLKGSSSGYYMQLVSNNIHALRTQTQGETGPALVMEIFNCMVTEVSSTVSSTPPHEFQKMYAGLGSDGSTGASGALDSADLAVSRQAVLAIDRELLLCP
eukprot:TRINITY_DN47908_c0_g1_i1.p1 TRINITY_DN47908_c0_g1~~TRINITY_DN47908_c0_g1_i1.p1  ORF type:complete len:541 (-),score=123.09 TRINITY_DN47908_c0_g1_i1:27-1442(-)